MATVDRCVRAARPCTVDRLAGETLLPTQLVAGRLPNGRQSETPALFRKGCRRERAARQGRRFDAFGGSESVRGRNCEVNTLSLESALTLP